MQRRKIFNDGTKPVPRKTTSCSLFRSQRLREENEENMCHTDLYAYIKVFGSDYQREKLIRLKSKVRRKDLLTLYREVHDGGGGNGGDNGGNGGNGGNNNYFKGTDFLYAKQAWDLSKSDDYMRDITKLYKGWIERGFDPNKFEWERLQFQVERIITDRKKYGGTSNASLRQYDQAFVDIFEEHMWSAEVTRQLLKQFFKTNF